jgi:hypothetical protein
MSRTPKVTDRLNRKNALVARLDRQIRLRGEPIEIRRNVGTSNTLSVTANVRGIVKPLTTEQLIVGTSQNFLVVLSPTDIRRTKWPGSKGADVPITGLKQIGHRPSIDNQMPTTSDVLFFRGAQANITGRSLVYDKGEIVRIELKVAGF